MNVSLKLLFFYLLCWLIGFIVVFVIGKVIKIQGATPARNLVAAAGFPIALLLAFTIPFLGGSVAILFSLGWLFMIKRILAITDHKTMLIWLGLYMISYCFLLGISFIFFSVK